jgi:hypothetical protein
VNKTELTMSIKQTVSKAIDQAIMTYIDQVATKYSLNRDDLLNDWEGYSSPPSQPSQPPLENLPSTQELLKCSVAELKALCKQRNLPVSGTKAKLVSLLAESNKPQETVSPKKAPPKEKTSAILKKVADITPTVAIRRNKWGNHEDPSTSFVFDKKSKKVMGKQNQDGSIDPLTKEDINICNKHKYDFIPPENLDHNKTLQDEQVDELAEDDDEDEEVIESEEELDEEELLEDEDEEDEEELLEEEYD